MVHAEADRVSEAGRPRYFDVRILSARERHRRWGREHEEPDRHVLWPGMKTLLLERTFGRSGFVVGAFDGVCDRIAARAVFFRSLVNPKTWHYGYLFTEPAYRKLGLGERVMRAGLHRTATLGAKFCDCYVAEDNVASSRLNEKLGFHKLGFVRVRLEPVAAPKDTIRVDRLRDPTPAPAVLERIGGPHGADLIKEELRPARPLRFWKHPNAILCELREGQRRIGYARCGPESANVAIEESEDDVRWEADCRDALSALAAQRGTRAAFAFVDRERWLRVRARWPDCTYDHVFWHPDVAES